MTEPSFVDLPETTVVGLRVQAPFRELFTAVPAAWRELFARAGELTTRLDEGFVECSLGSEDGLYTEIVGARLPAGSAAPQGMVAVVLPAARYAALEHRGALAGIASSFDALERWLTAAPAGPDGRPPTHDGVKLDVGYLPEDFGSTADATHLLYSRVTP